MGRWPALANAICYAVELRSGRAIIVADSRGEAQNKAASLFGLGTYDPRPLHAMSIHLGGKQFDPKSLRQ